MMKTNQKKKKINRADNISGYLFIGVAMIIFIMFTLYPVISALNTDCSFLEKGRIIMEIIKEINKEHGTTIIVYNTVFLMDFQNRELFMAST